MGLNDLAIRALKAANRVDKKADERGLYVEVRPGGFKAWRFKSRYAGEDKRTGFGAYPEAGLVGGPQARRSTPETEERYRSGG